MSKTTDTTTNTSAPSPRTCEGRKCLRTATVHIAWPSSDPNQPHEKYLCGLHYDADYRGRVPAGTLAVTDLSSPR